MSVDAREPHEDVAPSGGLQVEHDAALAAIDGVEARAVGADGARHLPRRIARRAARLLMTSAPEVGEQHRAERPGHHLRDVEHAETVEGARRALDRGEWSSEHSI